MNEKQKLSAIKGILNDYYDDSLGTAENESDKERIGHQAGVI